METSRGAPFPLTGARALAIVVTLLLLGITDIAIGMRSGSGSRLSEHFSAYRLKHYVARVGNAHRAVLIVGDSVLWGYGLPVEDTAVARLRSKFPTTRIINAAYEAGTPINVDFLVRYLLAGGMYPRAVVFDLNPISFNEFGRSYNTLNAALQLLAIPALREPFDRGRLRADAAAEHPPLWNRVDRFLELHWALYGSRVDIHQALFGDADAVTSLQDRFADQLGVAAPVPQGAIGPKTPYAEMYDLTPLTSGNVSYAYTDHLLRLLAAHHIPAIAILTPTNHGLLHDFIDVPAYDLNLRRLRALCRARGATVLDLDRSVTNEEFIDNTHLTKAGNEALAHAIAPALARVLRVF